MESIKQKAADLSNNLLKKLKNLSRNQKLLLGGLSSYLLYNSLKSILKKPKSISGKVIFITGAANGICRELAIKLSELGGKIAIVDICKEKGEELANSLLSKGQEAMFVNCDVSKLDSVKQAAAKVRMHLGPPSILINGAVKVLKKKILDMSIEEFEESLKIGLNAHFYTIKEFLPDMVRNNEGHIITMASVASHGSFPGGADYCACKHALYSLNETLRKEIKKMNVDVKTTIIQPGFTKTGLLEGLKIRGPLMDVDYVAGRIVKSILYDEEDLLIPRHLSFLVGLKHFVSVQTHDRIVNALGYSNFIDDLTSWKVEKDS
jgi:all-trans-retinol dehydrogenase (NAD+)